MLSEIIINHKGKVVERYKPDMSIDLLKFNEASALNYHPDGYYLCYSGGKDSDTLLDIAIKAGVKFSVHYNITSIDPPEALKHIKGVRKQLAEQQIPLYMQPPDKFTTGPFKGYTKNMWRLIITKTMPPTRLIRYCCDHLKERGGKGRLCLTGVRWDESTSRKSRRPMEVVTAKKANRKLFNDNDEGRRQFESCRQKGKKVINPIIAWDTEDIWEYLKKESISYCKLYNDGAERIGCIGCPMGGSKGMEEDFYRYPWGRELYIKTYDAMIEHRKFRNLKTDWKNGEEVLEWQMYGTDKDHLKVLEGQVGMWDEQEEEI